MAKVLDLEGVRRGDAHLERAKRLNPKVTKRPVPVAEIIGGEPAPRVTYGVSEVAQIVGLHPLTIRRAIAAGELKAANGGGKSPYRISRADLETFWRARGGGALLEPVANNMQASDDGDETEALLDATAAAARRAGYTTEADIDRLIQEVRAELKARKGKAAE
jgi:excisionase family DNA binding protein